MSRLYWSNLPEANRPRGGTSAIRREPFKVEYNGAWRLLIVYETAQRLDGETIVDGLPRSTLRDLSRRLVFVPAGTGFRE
jgi:AraC family transcriptional regulator